MKKVSIFIIIAALSLPGFAKKLATLPDLIKPLTLAVDDEQFYVAEGPTVHIYSLGDFELKKKFGKAGEGPQEFKIPPGFPLVIIPLKDSLLIDSLGRVSYFSKEGEFIKEISAKGPAAFFYQPIENGFAALGYTADQDTQSAFVTLNIYDEQLVKVKEIHRQPSFQRGRFEQPQVTPVFYVENNKIIMGGESGFVINIYDTQGTKVKSIEREYKQLKVTKEFKDRFHQFMKTNPQTKQFYDVIKNMVKFADYFPAIQFIYVADQKIYVLTFLEKDGKYEFFVFDINGKFLKRVFLPFKYMNALQPSPSAIKNDKFYQLVENEDSEEWELHAIEIK